MPTNKNPYDRPIEDLKKEQVRLNKEYEEAVHSHECIIELLGDQLDNIGHALTPLLNLQRTYNAVKDDD